MKEHIEISFPSEISNLTSLEINLQAGSIAQTPHTFQFSFPVLFLRKWMSLLRKYLPKEEACASL